MILTEIAIDDSGTVNSDAEITQEATFLCDLYIRLLSKYRTPKTGKVVIRLIRQEIDELNGFKIRKAQPVELLNIVEYWINFDFEKYQRLSKKDQIKYHWKNICVCMFDIAKKLNWETVVLEPIFQKGVDLNYQNIIPLIEKKKLKGSSYTISIKGQITSSFSNIYYELSNSDAHIFDSQEIFRDNPQWGFHYFFHKSKYRLICEETQCKLFYGKSDLVNFNLFK